MTRLPTPLRPLFPIAKRSIVAATELVAPLTTRLPRSPAQPGLPRHLVSSTPVYAAEHPRTGIAVTPVVPAHSVDRPPPIGVPAGHPPFDARRRAEIPEAFVATVPNGRSVGSYGAVIADDALLFDLSPYFGAFRPSQHPLLLRFRLPPVQDVPGRVAVLTTRGVDNYYHFIVDVLPRLELLAQAGVVPDGYVVSRRTRFQRELLDRLGVDEASMIEPEDVAHVRAEELVVPSLPDNHLRHPAWVSSWLRSRLLPVQPAAPHRRLYVGRGTARHTRRIENQLEVVAALEPLGFVSIDPGSLSVAEQIRLFAEAEIVVGAHGAAMTNAVFCPEGAAVVELFSDKYVNECYWNLVSTVDGLRYRYLVGSDRGRRRGGRMGPQVAGDIVVDVPLLSETLGDLGVSR